MISRKAVAENPDGLDGAKLFPDFGPPPERTARALDSHEPLRFALLAQNPGLEPGALRRGALVMFLQLVPVGQRNLHLAESILAGLQLLQNLHDFGGSGLGLEELVRLVVEVLQNVVKALDAGGRRKQKLPELALPPQQFLAALPKPPGVQSEHLLKNIAVLDGDESAQQFFGNRFFIVGGTQRFHVRFSPHALQALAATLDHSPYPQAAVRVQEVVVGLSRDAEQKIGNRAQQRTLARFIQPIDHFQPAPALAQIERGVGERAVGGKMNRVESHCAPPWPRSRSISSDSASPTRRW